jgi:hypothetical protein
MTKDMFAAVETPVIFIAWNFIGPIQILSFLLDF